MDILSVDIPALGMIFRARFLFDQKKKSEAMTQEKLAAVMDCSAGQVNMILSGERGKWMEDWLPRLAKGLNVEVWHLFADPGDLNTYPKHERPILAIFRGLDQAGRSDLLEYASFKLAAQNRDRSKI